MSVLVVIIISSMVRRLGGWAFSWAFSRDATEYVIHQPNVIQFLRIQKQAENHVSSVVIIALFNSTQVIFILLGQFVKTKPNGQYI